jgi:molybdopterin-dependent oxidoreductase alpha subunit
MKPETQPEIKIETPLEKQPARVKKQKRSAGGWPAVWTAILHMGRSWSPFKSIKGLLNVNQKKGYDCPGCAWPDPDGNRQIADFCENGAKAVAEETTSRRATPEVFANWSIAQLSELSDYRLGLLGRFTEPLIKKANASHYERITWQEAFQMISQGLNQYAADESVFYTSGKASNEAAFLFQLLARALGTNNLPDCSNMCHESSGFALQKTIGSGKGSVKLEDFDHADCILIVGQNPGTNHPRMLTALQKAVRNGCKIISINPMREAGLTGFMNPQEVKGILGISTPLSSLHLPVRINGDVALLKGIIKCLFETEEKRSGIAPANASVSASVSVTTSAIDKKFVDRYTTGFAELQQDIENTNWEEVLRESGISREQIQEAANAIMKSQRMITCWAMGLTQHKNAVANIEEIVNLHLLRGQLGKKGAGVCPVRGHSNVQGDRTMGIWEKMPDKFMKALSDEFHFTPPSKHGYDVVAALEAMHAGKVKNFVSLGGNFLSATPDTAFVAEAMKKLELFVHISTKPHRGHLVTAKTSLILPCLGRTEIDRQKSGPQFVTTENSMGVIERSEGHNTPASSHLKSEPAIIAGIAHATLSGTVDWNAMLENYDLIRDRIERVVPGFEQFNQRIKKQRFFYLPHAVRDELKFNTPSGKASLTVHPIPEPLLTKPEHFLLMTIRSHDQFNTTIYGEDDRYRGIYKGRRVIFMNEQDMRSRGFSAGQKIDITSHFQGETRQIKKFMVVPYEIPPRCVACYFPEANPLGQIANIADESRQPVYKSLVVTLEASQPSNRVSSEDRAASPPSR